MTDRYVLNAIQAYDPDGGEIEPTDAMHADHKSWAISRYGVKAWQDYKTDGWANPADWQDGADVYC